MDIHVVKNDPLTKMFHTVIDHVSLYLHRGLFQPGMQQHIVDMACWHISLDVKEGAYYSSIILN